jgi:hypothetical protein
VTDVLEHRGAFIQTLQAGPHVRKHIFDTLEERYGQDFESGRMGRKVYEVLYSAVQDAGVPEAVKEFENRFLPLLDRSRSCGNGKTGTAAAKGEDEIARHQNRPGGWAAALCAVVLVVGGLAVGLVFLNTLLPDPPTRMKTPVSRAQVTNPIRTITEAQPEHAIAGDEVRASEH